MSDLLAWQKQSSLLVFDGEVQAKTEGLDNYVDSDFLLELI